MPGIHRQLHNKHWLSGNHHNPTCQSTHSTAISTFSDFWENTMHITNWSNCCGLNFPMYSWQASKQWIQPAWYSNKFATVDSQDMLLLTAEVGVSPLLPPLQNITSAYTLYTISAVRNSDSCKSTKYTFRHLVVNFSTKLSVNQWNTNVHQYYPFYNH